MFTENVWSRTNLQYLRFYCLNLGLPFYFCLNSYIFIFFFMLCENYDMHFHGGVKCFVGRSQSMQSLNNVGKFPKRARSRSRSRSRVRTNSVSNNNTNISNNSNPRFQNRSKYDFFVRMGQFLSHPWPWANFCFYQFS